jgi:hypothetical protein
MTMIRTIAAALLVMAAAACTRSVTAPDTARPHHASYEEDGGTFGGGVGRGG